jgi:hypothetical protein
MSAGRGRALPPAQPGSFGAAVLNSYMWGFWLGVIYWLAGWFKADMAAGGSGYFFTALGISSTGWAKFWAVVLFLVATNTTSPAAIEYQRFTGRNFLQDRIGFAKAGGQDIGTMAGLVSTMFFLALFARIVPAFVFCWIRIPLLIVFSVLVGNWLARVLSRRAFTVLFGGSPWGRG